MFRLMALCLIMLSHSEGCQRVQIDGIMSDYAILF